MLRFIFQFVLAICAMLGAFSIAAAGLRAQDAPQAAPARADDPASAPTDDDPESMLPHFKDTRFWFSGQLNFIFHTHPDFHAASRGQNSLSPHYQKAPC